MKTCRLCGTIRMAGGVMICKACAAALDDYTAKRTGVKAEIRGQVIEALKIALGDLEDWHKDAMTWYDDDGVEQEIAECVCDTCRDVIPAVRAALERLEEKSE